MVEYAHKRMAAMGFRQDWLHGKDQFILGRNLTWQLERSIAANKRTFAFLVNIREPMVDVMSLLYALSELMGYVKSIQVWDAASSRWLT